MIKDLFIDVYGTIIDFCCNDLERALNLMSHPLYYRGLPLINNDISDKLKTLTQRGINIHIISGVPDPIESYPYISNENYREYFEKVSSITKEEILRLLPDVKFASFNFITQSASKAKHVVRSYGMETMSNSLLIDDNPRYCSEWKSYGSSVIKIGAGVKDLSKALDIVIKATDNSEESDCIELIKSYERVLRSGGGSKEQKQAACDVIDDLVNFLVFTMK